MNFLKIFRKNKFSPVRYYAERKKLATFFFVLKIFSYSIIFLFVFLVFLFFWNFVELKMIMQNTLNGKKNLEYAVQLLKEKNYDNSSAFALSAQEYFNSSIKKLELIKSRTHLQFVGLTNDNANDAISLLSAAGQLSSALSKVATFGKNINQITGPDKQFSALSRNEKRNVLGFIYESAPDLTAIKANIELALINIDKIKYRGLLNPFKGDISNFRDQLIMVHQIAENSIPASQIIPYIFGYPENANFLIIMQNNDELRPTGGFIGTYGILKTDSGDITGCDIHDIYHMDMPVKDKLNVDPPAPIKKYLKIDKWFLRDANWDPDWVNSAKKIEWFFNEENRLLPSKNQINDINGEIKGVIGINPGFVADLLKITGPITIENVEYNELNFSKLLEYRVEKGYIQLGEPSWERKEIIGKIFKEIKVRLFDKGVTGFADIFKVVQSNMERKNLLIYFKDPAISGIARDNNWTGEMVKTDSDYIMIVDSNMAALKTDSVIDRNVSYNIKQEKDGLFADLNISYEHNGKSDWRTTTYTSFTRVYVPLGSELIKAGGSNRDKFGINTENGKTVFSTFIAIKPGEKGSLSFLYKLPPYIINNINKGQYKLYFQKQPGNLTSLVAFDLSFVNSIKSYSPDVMEINSVNNNKLTGKLDFLTDKMINITF